MKIPFGILEVKIEISVKIKHKEEFILLNLRVVVTFSQG